jgi:hypothetical protein
MQNDYMIEKFSNNFKILIISKTKLLVIFNLEIREMIHLFFEEINLNGGYYHILFDD